MKIENYLGDGANWQAQCVLAYLRAHKDWVVSGTWDELYREYEAYVEVGRYENCREQGYVFSVRYKNKQINYAVYEHRNSDRLIVVRFEANTINTPTNDMVLKAMGGSKRNYTKAFSYGEIIACGNWIIVDAQKFIKENTNNENN